MAEMIVWTLAELQENFLRSYKIAQPDADTGPKGQPAIDARVAADMQIPLHANAQTIGDTSSLDDRTDEQLDEIGAAEGVFRPPAVGATGYVLISTATGGSTIFAGDEIKHKQSGSRYTCTATALYANGASVRIAGRDVGPGTNLPAGTELEWSNPRPGCSPFASVWSAGLTGGRERATGVEYKALIIERRKNPSAASNDGALLALIEDPFAHGIAVQKGFTYPAVKGTGTVGFSFTMPPDKPGGSRIPSDAQLAIILAAAESTFPGDDGIFGMLMGEQSAKVAFQVTWKKSAAQWADVVPWPELLELAPVAVSSAVAISASAFRVVTAGVVSPPLVGQTIALYDAANAKFTKKRILTVTEILMFKQWDLTFDMSAGASDTFVPASGLRVCPWSDSLNLLVPGVVDYIDHMGPGEVVSTFYDSGRRQRRQPENPESWTSEISSRLDAIVQAVPAVRSGTLALPSSTEATTVGTPGVLCYVRRLTDFSVYAEE